MDHGTTRVRTFVHSPSLTCPPAAGRSEGLEEAGADLGLRPYAHQGKASVAMGYVDRAQAGAGTALLIENGGRMCQAHVLGAPLHDPDGLRIRG